MSTPPMAAQAARGKSGFVVGWALALVYLLWGSTSPAMKIAVATVPPFWMAAVRFALAGSLLWGWCRLRRAPMPTAREVRGAALTGIVLLALGNGVYAATLRFIPSGVGSLVFALAPMWMAVFAFALDGERLSRLGAAGVALGLAGMLFLFSPVGQQNLPLLPTVFALGTSVAWGFGSIVQRRTRGRDIVQTSALQMLCAAVTLALFASIAREPLALAEFTPSSVAAMLYLVVCGSLIGFSAFLWLMSNVPTTLASTYAYINPLVALLIGIGYLHEPFSWRLVLGSAVILSGVALMMLAPRPHSAPAAR